MDSLSSSIGRRSTRSLIAAVAIVALSAMSLPAVAEETGSQAKGIVGTGTLGIVGTGTELQALGIVGTGSLIYSNGIVGTGALGIVGTGTELQSQGIVGTGVLGIVGTGTELQRQGIVGTGNLNHTLISTLPLVAVGPVEDVTGEDITVLGQTVYISDPTAIGTLNKGDTVAVFGINVDSGIAAGMVFLMDGIHVDGSSTIFLAGHLDHPQHSDGSFLVGDQAIRVGSAGADGESFELSPGDYVQIIGTLIDTEVLAENILTFR